MLVVFVSTVAFIALGASVHRHTGMPVVAVSSLLGLLAAALYALSVRLHGLLMKRLADEDTNPQAGRGQQLTEVTLRWVTHLTNLAFGIALAAVIPFVEAAAP